MAEERPVSAPAGGARAARAALRPVPLSEVQAPALRRLKTGIGELDRVLGGGIVPGSLVLIGGAPGIGKSTITGDALGNLAAAGHRVLYVSGEESAAQVKLRAERLGADALAGITPAFAAMARKLSAPPAAMIRRPGTRRFATTNTAART